MQKCIKAFRKYDKAEEKPWKLDCQVNAESSKLYAVLNFCTSLHKRKQISKWIMDLYIFLLLLYK